VLIKVSGGGRTGTRCKEGEECLPQTEAKRKKDWGVRRRAGLKNHHQRTGLDGGLGDQSGFAQRNCEKKWVNTDAGPRRGGKNKKIETLGERNTRSLALGRYNENDRGTAVPWALG